MLNSRRKRPLLFRPGCWAVFLLLGGAAVAAWYLGPTLVSFTPRFYYLTLTINGETRKLLPGETLALRPRDRVRIVRVGTNIPLDLGVRLVAGGLDVEALQYQEMPISSLLPQDAALKSSRMVLQVKYRNQSLGSVTWEIRPLVEDWLDKANRTIDPHKRIKILEEALKAFPGEARLRERLLEEYQKLRMWKRVVSLLEAQAKDHPDRTTLLRLLEGYEALKDPQGTIRTLERLLQVDPEDLESRLRVAQLLESRKAYRQAAGHYEKLLKHLPPDDSLSILKQLGYLYTELGDEARAIRFFQKASRLDQKDPNLYYNLAYLYEKKGDLKKAAFYLGNALTLSPEDMEGRLKLAGWLIQKKDYTKAKELLEEVLERRPKSLDALVLMTRIAEAKQDRHRLKSLYKRILVLAPKNETVAYNLGLLEYEDGNLKQSLPYLEGFAKRNPKDKEVHALLMDIHQRLKQEDKAAAEAHTLLGLDPDNLTAYSVLLEHLAKKGDYAALAKTAAQGIRAHPKAAFLREYAVVALLKLHKETEAVKEMQALARLKPKDVELRLNLARLLEKLGRLPEAKEAYKEVLGLDPSNEEAGEAYLRLRLEVIKESE